MDAAADPPADTLKINFEAPPGSPCSHDCNPKRAPDYRTDELTNLHVIREAVDAHVSVRRLAVSNTLDTER